MNKLIRIHLTSIHELKSIFDHLAEGLCSVLHLPFAVESHYFVDQEKVNLYSSAHKDTEDKPYIVSISKTFSQNNYKLCVERNLSYWHENELNDAEVKLTLIGQEEEFVRISGSNREGIFFSGVLLQIHELNEELAKSVLKLVVKKLDYKVLKVRDI